MACIKSLPGAIKTLDIDAPLTLLFAALCMQVYFMTHYMQWFFQSFMGLDQDLQMAFFSAHPWQYFSFLDWRSYWRLQGGN